MGVSITVLERESTPTCSGTRFEIETAYIDQTIAGFIDNGTFLGPGNLSTILFSGVDLQTVPVMLNLLKEIPIGNVTGYVGGGIGYSFHTLSLDNGIDDSDEALAYQFVVGADLPVSEKLSLFAQYKLMGIEESSFFGDAFELDHNYTSSIAVGARYNLGGRYVDLGPAGKNPISECSQRKRGCYAFGYGGYSFDYETNVSEELLAGVVDETVVSNGKGDFIFGGGVGLATSAANGVRFELEGLYAQNAIDSTFPVGPFDFDAEVQTTAIMFNVLKEIPFGQVTGYVGGGIGYANTDLDFVISAPGSGGSVGASAFEDTVETLAYQIVAGADFPISDNLSLFTQYKLFNPRDLNFLNDQGIIDDPVLHSVSFGARWFFGN